ncbi:MAG TPA: hypothetical protein VFU75_10015 [Gemmatimonadales bacterium]|nr:hypothetical protein [Gemmatimonadales bacterium]
MRPEEVVALMAVLACVFLVTRPLVSAFARRISRDPGTPAVTDGAVDELRADLEEAHRRIAGLEERVDFAERMLAKQREPERLVPPRN